MNPIAGLVTDRGHAEHQAVVQRMLAACGVEAGSCEVVEAAGAVFGAGPVSVALEHGLLVALDGRIYGHEESTDVGRLGRLYREHPPAVALSRVNGDFGSAVYDTATRTLHLARDRFGVRPMYYAQTPQGFAFCSRPQGILALGGVSPEPSRDFLGLFAGGHYRYFDNDLARSPFEAVLQLPAGHCLRWCRGRCVVELYWELRDQDELAGSEADLAEQYRDLLIDAVRIRLQGAARPAFTLSGGMDSSSVLACAATLTAQRPDALSAVYDDKTFDESDDIRPMVQDMVARWHAVRVDGADCFDRIDRMIRDQGEPIPTATWLSHDMVCRRAATEGYEVLFGGLGGDELNAGEYEHYLYHFADLRADRNELAYDHEILQWAAHHDHPIYRKSAAVAERELARLTDSARPGRCLVDRQRMHRYATALDADFFDLTAFEPVMDHPFSSCLKNRTAQDLLRETIPPCLRATYQQCAAHGLEPRLPFLDHRLVEFMFRVSGSLKIRDGVSKVLLRSAMRGIVPDSTRTRVAKTGFNAPAHTWFAGPGREPLADLINSRAFRERGIYDLREVQRLFDEHQRIVAERAQVDNHMMFFWQLVNLELWLRQLQRPAVSQPRSVPAMVTP